MEAHQTAQMRALTIDAVRWGIETLGSQRIHPAFIFYLYLRKKWVEGDLKDASASSPEVRDLLEMPGGPPTKPYYRPLRERGARTGELLDSFWMAKNLAGSWSEGSLKRQEPSAWLVSSSGDYTVPADHASQAKEKLLFGSTVSANAMGAYFLRNYGFKLDGEGGPADVVNGFRLAFRFGEEHEEEFSQLFTSSPPAEKFAWFEDVPINTEQVEEDADAT